MSELALQLVNVSPNDAATLQKLFFPFEEQATQIKEQVYAIEVTSIHQVAEMNTAREYRLKLQKLRIESEKTKKREKEESLRKGKAIDAVYNYILSIIEPMEKHLQWQEEFTKRKEENEREAKINARKDDLIAYGVDPNLYNIASMPDDIFMNLLQDSKEVFIQNQENVKKAEEARIAKEKAQEEENKRIRIENEKLKAEAEKQRLAMEKEKQKAQVENDAIEAEQKAKEVAHQEALNAERKEREKVEAKIREQEEAQKKAEDEESARIKGLALAPDKEKLVHLANSITAIQIPEVTSEEAKTIIQGAVKMLAQASEYLRTQAISL